MPDLGDVDLALLRSLDVLLAEAHVTRAARQLGLTQSAMSHRLRQLRAAFDDPLLVPSPDGLVPTPRAEALIGPVRNALRDLSAALRAVDPFDPATCERTFTLAMPDYTMASGVPAFLPRLAAAAPGVALVLETVGPDVVARLASGAVDLAFTARPQEGAGLRRRRFWREGFVVLARRRHPALAGGAALDLDTYVALRHVLVAPGGRAGGVVDAALEALGRRRRVAVRLPSFVPAPFLVASTDLVLTAPRGLAETMARPLGLGTRPAPLPLPEVDAYMFWHERADLDPAHRWLRARITETFDEGAGEGV